MLSLLVEYKVLVEYIDTIDIGTDVVNAGMCQLVLSDETLFSYWVRYYWWVHFRMFSVIHSRGGLTRLVSHRMLYLLGYFLSPMEEQ